MSTTGLQTIALDALQHHELGLAECLYEEMFDILEVILRDFVLVRVSNLLKSREFMALLLKDAQVTISLGWLAIKSHRSPYLEAIVTKMQAYVSDKLSEAFDNLPLEIRAYAFHLLVLINLYVCQSGGETSQKTLGEVVNQLASFGDGFPHITHDRAILAQTTDRNSPLTKAHLPFEHCSVSVLGVPEFPRCKESDVLKTPEHFVGWLNKDMFRSLDNKTRREINDIQAANGLEQTDFSEY